MGSEQSEAPVIVVAEDDAILRLYTACMLEDEGFTVLEAADAEGALRIMDQRSDVRLLFTDIQMPGKLDGLDLLDEVHRRWPNVLLVVTSGRIQPTKRQIPDDGRFVAKPYIRDELMAQINDLMKT